MVSGRHLKYWGLVQRHSRGYGDMPPGKFKNFQNLDSRDGISSILRTLRTCRFSQLCLNGTFCYNSHKKMPSYFISLALDLFSRIPK